MKKTKKRTAPPPTILEKSVSRWEDVLLLKEPCFVPFTEFFSAASSSDSLSLTAWSSQDNQFTPYTPPNEYGPAQEVLGSLTVGGVTCVFFLDPEDGYRSSLNKVLLLPQHKPKHPFVPFSVSFNLTSSNEWEGENNGICFDLVISGTDDVIARVGTEIFDNWYPNAVFQIHPEVLHEHLPFFSKKDLTEKISPIKESPRIRKKI